MHKINVSLLARSALRSGAFPGSAVTVAGQRACAAPFVSGATVGLSRYVARATSKSPGASAAPLTTMARDPSIKKVVDIDYSETEARTDPGSTPMKRAMLWAMGYYSKESTMIRASRVMYNRCAHQAMNKSLYEELALEHNFRTEFELLSIHVWCCLVRLRSVEGGGRDMQQIFINIFWDDAVDRVRNEGYTQLRWAKQLKELQNSFYGSAVAYDQGVYGDDTALAAALWRNLYGLEGSATSLLAATKFVRRQVSVVDACTEEQMIKSGEVPFYAPANRQWD